jgi:tetratricopeptide (TPR) repeat protein
LGNALREKGDLEAAIQAHSRAIQLAPNYAMAHYGLGNILRDKKELDSAIRHFQKALQINPTYAEANCNLGLALKDQGRFAEALKYLEKGHQFGSKQSDWNNPSEEWVEQVRALLQQEQRVDAILQRQARAADPAEQLQLAWFCQTYKRYSAALRLYTTGLAARPDLAKRYRYPAACAAALTAVGQGKDAAPLTADEKAALRKQALDWLWAHLKQQLAPVVAGYLAARTEGTQPPASPLEKLAAPAKKPGPESLVRVWHRLQRCQTNPELASLRDDQQIAQLPAMERQDWRTFWQEVRTLEKQARTCFTDRSLTGRLADPRKEQVHELKLSSGRTYFFNLESKDFDPLLRMENATGKKMSEAKQDNNIMFTPPTNGTCRLVVTSVQQRGGGAYVLHVWEFPSVVPKATSNP